MAESIGRKVAREVEGERGCESERGDVKVKEESRFARAGETERAVRQVHVLKRGCYGAPKAFETVTGLPWYAGTRAAKKAFATHSVSAGVRGSCTWMVTLVTQPAVLKTDFALPLVAEVAGEQAVAVFAACVSADCASETEKGPCSGCPAPHVELVRVAVYGADGADGAIGTY